MNRERLIILHDEIADAPEHMVDMRVVGAPGCGTPGCVMGWVHTLWPLSFSARAALGLGWEEGNALFIPLGYELKGAYLKADVLAVLTHAIEHGEIKWPDACPRATA